MKKTDIDMTPQVHPYPETTMFGAIRDAAERTPDAYAFDFEGKLTTFSRLIEKDRKSVV